MGVSKKIRLKVYEKYGGRCGYTGQPLPNDWQVDHVIPPQYYHKGVYGGEVNDLENLKIQRLTKGEIRESALIELRWRKCYVWRNSNVRAVPGRTFIGLKGVSDIIGFHLRTGLALYCEIKTATDKLSPDQILFLTKAKEAGCIVLIASDDRLGNFQLIEFGEYLK